MDTPSTSTGTQRVIALVVLVAIGLLSLPLTAAVADGESTDDLVVPLQLVLMAVVGAVVGYLLPGLGGAGSTRQRSAALGVVIGLALALVSVAVFYLLLD